MLTPIYAKPHQTSAQLISHLEQKGLIVADKPFAEAALRSIGYERLRIYALARRDRNHPDKPFFQNTTFENIIGLYRLDEQLRAISFSGCSKFEITFRNTMSEVLTRQYGCHPFFREIFSSDDAKMKTFKALNETYFQRISLDDRATHYFKNYNNPSLPPMWKMKEFFTFNKCLTFFSNIKDEHKADISQAMGINRPTHDIFYSWAKAIIDLRNACAHHDRIFNRKFQKQPQKYRNGGVFSKGKSDFLSGQLECIDFIMSHFGEDDTHYDRAKSAIMAQTSANLHEIGF